MSFPEHLQLILFTNFLTDASGRTFYRHESGMGTVMGWVDKKGVRHQTLVLDASYRNALPWGGGNSTYISSTNNFKAWVGISSTSTPSEYMYISTGTSSSSSETSSNTKSASSAGSFIGTNKSDPYINTLRYFADDPYTSRQNTSNMINKFGNSTTLSAGWCRSKKVSIDGNIYYCDLPNCQILIRIYCSQFTFDDLDTTSNGNKYLFTKSRSGCTYNWYFNNNNYSAWSSSEWGLYSTSSWLAWCINNNGIGGANFGYKSNSYGVIPVIELS